MWESRLETETGLNSLVAGATYASVRAKLLQSSPTLWDLMDCSPASSSVQGVFQARILQWVIISSSWGSSQEMQRSHPRLLRFLHCRQTLLLSPWRSPHACQHSFIQEILTELNMCHVFLLDAEGIATKWTDRLPCPCPSGMY